MLLVILPMIVGLFLIGLAIFCYAKKWLPEEISFYLGVFGAMMIFMGTIFIACEKATESRHKSVQIEQGLKAEK